VPTYLDCRLSVEDSPNSGGVVIDAIRCCKLALNHRVSGALFAPASYFMKSPPKQYTDTEARAQTEKFIARYAKKAAPPKARKKPAPKKK
jgi:myo-inositol-1-phosphate synthase